MDVSPQAKRLAAAITALGAPRRGFAVRTDTYQRSGVRYYGNAYLVCYRRAVTDLVLAHAAELRAQGFRVHTFGTEGAQCVSVSA